VRGNISQSEGIFLRSYSAYYFTDLTCSPFFTPAQRSGLDILSTATVLRIEMGSQDGMGHVYYGLIFEYCRCVVSCIITVWDQSILNQDEKSICDFALVSGIEITTYFEVILGAFSDYTVSFDTQRPVYYSSRE
jgi:hypothetical protein